jgi:cytochrome d ubiquinol oxidase subunit II
MLANFWFVLIAVLWTGFLVLEGFDFGVAILLPVLTPRALGPGDRETDRRAVLSTIGPVWDGNEVWLLTAGGAMFAAFPEWYASLFSGLYLPLFLLLMALIVRGISTEYRGKAATAAGRAWCDRGITGGGFVAALLVGVAFANMVRGVTMTADHRVTAGFFDLLNPYALLGGVAVVLLCVMHGAVFLSLKTAGPVRERAARAASALSSGAVVVVGAFLALSCVERGSAALYAVAAAAFTGLVATAAAVAARRDGWAFVASAATIGLLVASWFVALFPDVLPARGGAGLSISQASSTHYTLTVMTVVALVVTPVVLAYQTWTYWVFRARVTGAEPPALTAFGSR